MTTTTTTTSRFPPTYLKAVVAFISTLLAQLGALLADGTTTFGTITDGQWVAVAGATFAATALVYGIGNGKDADPTTSTPAEMPLSDPMYGDPA